MVRDDPLVLEILAVLDEDLAAGAKLMQPRYRANAIKTATLDGYCAVGAAAYYFFEGDGRKSHLQPMQRTYHGGSHWWLVRNGSEVLDFTIRPGERGGQYPYEKGGPRGFVSVGYQRAPTRAKEVIARVRRRRRRR